MGSDLTFRELRVHDNHEYWCLRDPLCVALASAIASGVLAVAGRIMALDDRRHVRGRRRAWEAARCCIGSAAVSGIIAGALCLLGGERWPGNLTSVACVTVLAGWGVDYSSRFARRLLVRLAVTTARACLKEIADLELDDEETVRASRAQTSFPDDDPDAGPSGL